MRSTSERIFLVLGGLFLVLLVAAVAFQTITEQRRTAALARMKLPAVIARQLDGGAAPAAASEQGAQSGAARDPRESAASFSDLFAKASAVELDPRWKESYYEVMVGKPPSQWSPEELATAKAFAEAAKDVVREIRKQAELGGPAKVLDYSQGAAIDLPHLARLRECARMLMVDAKVESQLGNAGEVTEDLLAIFKVGNLVKDEPILISQLVRCAIDHIAFESAEQSLSPTGLSPELAQRIVQAVGRIDNRESFAESFSGEGMMGLDSFDLVRSGNTTKIMQMMGHGGIPDGITEDRVLATVYGSVFTRPWLNMDETAYADTMTRVREAAQLPYVQARSVMEQIEHDVTAMPRTRLLTRALIPGLTTAIAAQARDEAFLTLIRVGLAVELYHTQSGAYPASLDAVSSILGGKIPVDPFNGKALGYKLEGQSFVLYSVGQDQVDNGGQQGYKADGQLDLLKGDLVWRALPKPEAASEAGGSSNQQKQRVARPGIARTQR